MIMQPENTISIPIGAVAAIMEKALQCYVIECSYPSDIEYLEENYGLIVNHKDFRIMYTPVAENLPPQIKVAY